MVCRSWRSSATTRAGTRSTSCRSSTTEPARAVGCELLPSRYDRVVEARGGHGEYVERPEELEAAMARAVASGRPACVNVAIEGVAGPAFKAPRTERRFG